MTPARTDDLDGLAAEYALGLPTGEDLARCERLAAEDAGFAAAVEAWRERLAGMDRAAPALAPPEALWSRIEASLTATAPSPAPRPAAARPAAAPPDPWWRALWGDLRVWRGVGLAGAAAALVLALALGAALRESRRAPVLVAILLGEADRPAAIVNAFADGRTELVPLNAIAAPPGRSLQVWTLWDRARGPVSVGLLDALRSVDLAVKGLPAPARDQLYEVTLEPAGGSPTGRPTGPVLMKGLAAQAL
ncbi:anti-sigma factor [Alsobacter sp. KACC 23698]|uniref:Anti-sigma factor n=1 Tax=Alsobacter sp. KACC 23698 TaxID=3149229 RepID=A0AAU7JB20_9HYPH